MPRLLARLEAVDLVSDNGFDFPLTQTDVADAVGLSTVHVNRTLQALRQDGLVEWDRKRVQVLDRRRLERFADFNPTYLNLFNRPR